MKTDHEIRKNIMRRVYITYFVRQATSPALRLGALGGALLVLTQIVSVRDVALNALGTSGLSGFTSFLYSAMSTTEASVLVLTILAVGLVLWFAVDTVQSAIHTPQAV